MPPIPPSTTPIQPQRDDRPDSAATFRMAWGGAALPRLPTVSSAMTSGNAGRVREAVDIRQANG